MIHVPVAAFIAAVVLLLAVAGYAFVLGRKVRIVVNRLAVLGTLLAPAKSGKKNPEMRIVLAQKYLAALYTWMGGR